MRCSEIGCPADLEQVAQAFEYVVRCYQLNRLRCSVTADAKVGRASLAKRFRDSTGSGASGETTGMTPSTRSER